MHFVGNSMVCCSLQGVRVQDTKEISSWDILEGTKNSGPLMLSWFGAVRMKRKPLKYEEQRRLVRFHTHQSRFQDMMFKTHYVSLPDLTPVAPEEEPVDDSDKVAAIPLEEKALGNDSLPSDGNKPPIAPGQQTAPRSTQGGQGPIRPAAPNPRDHMATMQGSFQIHQPPPHMRGMTGDMARRMLSMGRGATGQMFMSQPGMGGRPPGAPVGTVASNADAMRHKLHLIRQAQIQRSQSLGMSVQVSQGMQRFPQQANQPPPMYPGNVPQQPGGMMVRGPGPPMAAYAAEQQRLRFQEALQRMPPEQRAIYMQRQRLRAQQLQHQRAAMVGQVMGPQYAPQPRAMYRQQIRPMQANPPMPMHAQPIQPVVQQGFRPGPAAPQQQQQQHMMMRPPTQQPIQYQQPGGMNPMHGQQMF